MAVSKSLHIPIVSIDCFRAQDCGDGVRCSFLGSPPTSVFRFFRDNSVVVRVAGDRLVMTGQQGKRQKGRTSCSQTANESGDQERGTEGLPIEVIGNILSHVADVKDVAMASWTC